MWWLSNFFLLWCLPNNGALLRIIRMQSLCSIALLCRGFAWHSDFWASWLRAAILFDFLEPWSSSINGMLVYWSTAAWLGVVLHRQCWQWRLLCVGVVVVRLPRVSCLPESEQSIGWLSLALGAATYCGFITFFFNTTYCLLCLFIPMLIVAKTSVSGAGVSFFFYPLRLCNTVCFVEKHRIFV